MENVELTSFHFNSQRVNEGIGEMTQAKNEMNDYVNSVFEYTRLIRKNSLFEYCTALDQMLNELLVRAQGIAYGEALLDIYKNSSATAKKAAKEDYERVSGQYSLNDINFVSVLSMLNNLKRAALEINFSNGQVFDSYTSKIGLNILNNSLVTMISSANNVNSNLMSLKDARLKTRQVRWDALTDASKKFATTEELPSQIVSPALDTIAAVPIVPAVIALEDEEKEDANKDDKKSEEKEDANKDDKKSEEKIVIPDNNNDNKDEKENKNINIDIEPIKPFDNNDFINTDKSNNTSWNNTVWNNSSVHANSSEFVMPEENNSIETPEIVPVIEEQTGGEDLEPITINTTTAVSQNKKSSGINLGPVFAGAAAATAVGVGAKVYLDNRKNNDNGEEQTEDEYEEDFEEVDENKDNIAAEEWQDPSENMLIDDDESFEVTLDDLGEI